MAKVALITGAARRVGRATALALANAGMDIAFTWNRSATEADALKQLIESAGRNALAIKVDFRQADAVETIVARVRSRFDRLDALINNASVFSPSPLHELDHQRFVSDMRVNAEAPLLLIQAFAPDLAAHYSADDPASSGRVVNFIDIHVLSEPMPGYVSYNASKAALLEITKTCALELAPEITVNAIAPGVVAWAPFYTEEQKAEYLQRVPLARPGVPEDAATAVRFLVMDAHYCTGEVIQIDGGRHLT